jgi:hypothetical protein
MKTTTFTIKKQHLLLDAVYNIVKTYELTLLKMVSSNYPNLTKPYFFR